MTTHPFTRETLYIVVNVKDTEAALTQTEQAILRMIGHKVANWRTNQGKTKLSGVFVEHDWPEHDGVLAAIEQRMTGKPPEPLVWPDLECAHDWFSGQAFANAPKKRTCFYCKKTELIT